MNDCLFCRIVAKTIPSKMVFENDRVVVFHDINPKAKHHLLIVPKRHVDSVMTMEESDQELMGLLIWTAKNMGDELGLEGYQLRLHVGRKGGQEVDHVHLHLLAD